MSLEKGSVVVGGAEESIKIPIIVKGIRRMMQTDERVFLPVR